MITRLALTLLHPSLNHPSRRNYHNKQTLYTLIDHSLRPFIGLRSLTIFSLTCHTHISIFWRDLSHTGCLDDRNNTNESHRVYGIQILSTVCRVMASIKTIPRPSKTCCIKRVYSILVLFRLSTKTISIYHNNY